MTNIVKKVPTVFVKICMYLLLLDFTFVFLFPFLYMAVTSMKSNADLNNFAVNWIPSGLEINNYLLAAQVLEFGRYFVNSAIVTVFATLGHLVSCSFIGYGFARYNFPGKKILFFFVILALIVPIQTIIVPMYMIFVNLNWLDTFLPLIVPAFFGFGLKGALFIFLFKQYYSGIPKELEEAAYIDGCGHFMTYVRIVLPIARTIFVVTIVLSMVWHWNDFYEPSLYLKKPLLAMLPSRLNALLYAVNNPPEEFQEVIDAWPVNNAVLMAGAFMVTMPVAVIFGFLQKKFVQGIERAGLTGE